MIIEAIEKKRRMQKDEKKKILIFDTLCQIVNITHESNQFM